MRTVTVIQGQSILDIAVQYCGSVDASYAIAKLSNLTLDATLLSGQTLLVPEVTDRRVVEELRRRGVDVASRWVEPLPPPPPPPIFFRLANHFEWEDERLSWSSNNSDGAFSSPLKLPSAGYRTFAGTLLDVPSGYYFNSSSSSMFFDNSTASLMGAARANGLSVRLIADGIFEASEYLTFKAVIITISGLNYGLTYNDETKRIWLDRNLGASRIAQSSTDSEAYGWLYQWGRNTDGHQIRTSTTTSTLSSSDTPGHGNFIITNTSPYDWRSPQNINLWQGVDGINNPGKG